MRTGPSLTLCAMTLRGAALRERVDAAAQAGFDAIGLTLDHYRAARREGTDDAAIRGLLAERGLRIAEVETPWDWAADPADAQAAADGELLFHVLDAFDCRRFNAVQFTAHPRSSLVGAFSAMCRRAADHGVTVALEFMPFSRLPALADALDVLDAAAEPNAGVLLDVWHFHRTGGTPEELDRLPVDRVVAVQLNDAGPDTGRDPREEARHLRRLPGDGEIPLIELLTVLRRNGSRAPLSVEVWSDALEALAPATAAAHAFEATRRVLDLVP